MSGSKGIVIVVIAVLLIGIVVAGGSYLLVRKKHKNAAEQLQTAKDLLENNKQEEALRLLKEHIAKYPDMETTPEALFYLAQTLHNQNSSKAAELFDRLLNEYPDSAFTRRAYYYKALQLIDKRPITSECKDFFREQVNTTENDQVLYVAQYGLALYDMENGKYTEAKESMDNLMEREIPAELRAKMETSLGDLNLRLLYSPEAHGEDEYYTIKKGDYIYKLAQKYNVTQELLMKCNSITDPKKISIGQRMKIPLKEFSILVDKYTNTLTLLANGKFFKKYSVRTGAYENQTPIGEFKIHNKKKNPRWVNPRTHELYAPGDPGNELGTRWMSFQSDMLGIHGTIKPESVGYYSSFGCVGMYREDVEELFDLIPLETPIKIVGQMNPEIVEKSKILGFRD